MMTRPSHLLVPPLLAAALSLLACSARDTTPAGHPADPAAAEAPPAPPPAQPEPVDQDDAPGHDHGDHQTHGDHQAHGQQQPGPADTDPLIAAEMTAYQAAKPVFDTYCAGCHTTGTGKPKKARKEALKHFSMDAYPFTGHHVGELGETVRKVLGVGKGKATMPMDDPGAVKGEELALVVAWTKAYDQAAQAGAGYHGEAKGNDHGGHGH